MLTAVSRFVVSGYLHSLSYFSLNSPDCSSINYPHSLRCTTPSRLWPFVYRATCLPCLPAYLFALDDCHIPFMAAICSIGVGDEHVFDQNEEIKVTRLVQIVEEPMAFNERRLGGEGFHFFDTLYTVGIFSATTSLYLLNNHWNITPRSEVRKTCYFSCTLLDHLGTHEHNFHQSQSRFLIYPKINLS